MTSFEMETRDAIGRGAFADPADQPRLSHVDVGAILGGAVVAAAISWVMTSFGAGIGLAAASTNSDFGHGGVAIGVATGLWVLWIAVSSFAVGGYIAARMRRLTFDSSEHERDLRDGAHGLLAWAVGVIFLACLAVPAVVGVTKGLADSGAARAIARTSGDSDATGLAHAVDRLSRSGASGAPADTTTFRGDLQRSLELAASSGAMAADDKAYLSQQIAAREGVTPAEATTRIDDAVARLAAAAQKAREVAASARRAGVILAFLTGASLVVSAAAAWWAASMGGKHRDQQFDISHLTNWR
jgi:hypothetical protein